MATHILAEHIELLEGTLDATARTVEVVLIRPGWSKNVDGPYYPSSVLAKAASLYENSRAFANHPTPKEIKERKGNRRVEDMTGRFFNVHVGEKGELRATRKVYDNPAGNAVWPAIVDSIENKVPTIALSINSFGKAKSGTAPDGKKGLLVESIDIVNSVDDVIEGAAGGSFESLVAGSQSIMADLLSILTYDEYVEARPDFVEALRKQLKRARQDDAVRALTDERDAAQAALTEAQTANDTLTEQLADARAKLARQEQLVTLEQALRAADYNAEYEQLLRQQLEGVDPSEWANIVRADRQKLRAAGVQRVAVHGAPLRESAPVIVQQHNDTGPINPDDFDSPRALVREINRRLAEG